MFLLDLHKRFPETFIVAEKCGQIVGYIICRIEGGFSRVSLNPFSIANKGHIISIAVLPEHRQKGLGSALVKEALQVMSTHYNVKSCYLEVRVSNTGAIELYKKAGFEIARTIRGYYSDGEAALMMRRKF
jgi:ribosomal-protein-alanine N-acetyltransferase